MSGTGQLLLAAGVTPVGGYAVDAAKFNGVDAYMVLGSNLAGIANTKSGIFSVWVRLDDSAFNDLGQTILFGTGPLATEGIFFGREFDNFNNEFATRSGDGATAFGVYSALPYLAGPTWRHILASWDGATGVENFYVNDVSSMDGSSSANNVNCNYTDCTFWMVGADGYSGEQLCGCLAELYFAPGQYLDISVVGNRRKFISASGKPVYLGATGSLPTGTAPRILNHLADGEAPAHFALNRGTGGDFSIVGTLTTGSTSPTD